MLAGRVTVDTDLDAKELAEVWHHVEPDAVDGSVEHGDPDEQDAEHQVRHRRREVDHLKRGDRRPSTCQLPVRRTQMRRHFDVGGSRRRANENQFTVNANKNHLRRGLQFVI